MEDLSHEQHLLVRSILNEVGKLSEHHVRSFLWEVLVEAKAIKVSADAIAEFIAEFERRSDEGEFVRRVRLTVEHVMHDVEDGYNLLEAMQNTVLRMQATFENVSAVVDTQSTTSH